MTEGTEGRRDWETERQGLGRLGRRNDGGTGCLCNLCNLWCKGVEGLILSELFPNSAHSEICKSCFRQFAFICVICGGAGFKGLKCFSILFIL